MLNRFWLTYKGLNIDCLYIYADLLGEELNRGVIRGKKWVKHCKSSWFMEI
jgi:hypothetical protein